MTSPKEHGNGGSGRAKPLVKLAVLGLLLAGGTLTARLTPLGGYFTPDGVGQAIAQLRGNPWAPVLFIAAYAAATAFAVPGTILTLAGGGLFGVFWGTVYNSIAANIGANAAFLLARGLGRDGVRRLLGDRSAALTKLDDAVGAHGFRGLLTLRLIPLVPFNALNFGAGLLPLRWPTYALATVVGIFPGTVVYTFFADALLQGSQDASQDALVRVLIAGGLLVLLTFLPTILKRLNVRLPGFTGGVLFLSLSWAVPVGAQPALPDHGPLTTLLQAVVTPDGVDYAQLADRAQDLDSYLGNLSATRGQALSTASPNERLAFWINAYNACMLKRVIDHYPIQRARGIQGLKNTIAGRPANSVWQITDVFTGAHCTVAGSLRSQDEIEHEIIRPMGDPRIHFAINCAARSCPPLTADAYEADRLDQQLDERVEAFLADRGHFQATIDGADGPTLRLNRVLDWFSDDFGGESGLRDFLSRYATGPVRATLVDPSAKIEFMEYDWTLNDVVR